MDRLLFVILAAFILLSAAGCSSRVPVEPGQVPAAEYVTPEDEAYGLDVLAMLSQQYPVEQNDSEVFRVRDLVERLATAAHADSSPWNVYVLRGDDVVNAAATRGNFVFVWTGMLHTAYTDAELATVLSHEIGHVLAHHTHATPEEEGSQILADISGNVASSIVSTQGAYGALAQLAGIVVSETIKAMVVNPEQQRQELEADHIGFFLMADAGFDPREAIGFWTRFHQQNDAGGQQLQFFSSHPATEERIEALEALLPAAMERYEQALAERSGKKKPSQRKQKGSSVKVGDTFSLGKQGPGKQTQRFIVSEPASAVHSEPAESAPVVQSLAFGDHLEVAGQNRGWAEVYAPAPGFVPSQDISPDPLPAIP